MHSIHFTQDIDGLEKLKLRLRRERDSIDQQLSQYKEQLHQAQDVRSCMVNGSRSVHSHVMRSAQEDAPRHSERYKNAEQELQMPHWSHRVF